jgi:hypothetical protein
VPRTCTVCRHAQLPEIDDRLIRNEPFRSIADHYGLSQSALKRHKAGHLPVDAADSRFTVPSEDPNEPDRHETHGERLLRQAAEYREKAITVLEQAQAAGRFETALKALKEVRGYLELEGKLLGQIATGTQIALGFQVGGQLAPIEQDAHEFSEAAQVLESYLAGTNIDLLEAPGGLPEGKPEPSRDELKIEPSKPQEPEPPEVDITWPHERDS